MPETEPIQREPELGFQILRVDGHVDPEVEPKLDPLLLRRMMAGMLTLRCIDERMLKLQRQGRIAFYGTSMGQEASVIGSALALQPDDWCFPALREVGVALIRGYRMTDLTNQVFGNRRDLLQGRQMPCHYSDRRINHVAWSSCIANQLPQATGAAMAARHLGQHTAVIAYMGDGATSEGDFHVALNFAGVFKAPVVFFCQNNQWAISVPFRRQTAAPSIAARAEAYGMAGIRIDGNDILAVYTATSKALMRARRGQGPTLLEALTYRIGAHSTSDDPTRYRDSDEVDRWKRLDPIDRFRRYLTTRNLWNEAMEKESLQDIGDDIRSALKNAESIPAPDPASMFNDVYASVPWHLEEQRKAYLDYISEKDRWNG